MCFLMFFLFIQILMNVKRRKPVSALSVAARIPGGATTAVAVEIFCISGTMIPALVSPATHPLRLKNLQLHLKYGTYYCHV